jgi:hypothetical protein
MFQNFDGPSNVRRGRFLWMAESARREYLKNLKERIDEGYFFRDAVLKQIADDLAPLYVDSTGPD